MHHFLKISLTLKISHGLQNKKNIEILMKLENFYVFSFLALCCERKDLYKDIVFYVRLANVAEEKWIGFYLSAQTNLCFFHTQKKAKDLFDTEKKVLEVLHDKNFTFIVHVIPYSCSHIDNNTIIIEIINNKLIPYHHYCL